MGPCRRTVIELICIFYQSLCGKYVQQPLPKVITRKISDQFQNPFFIEVLDVKATFVSNQSLKSTRIFNRFCMRKSNPSLLNSIQNFINLELCVKF